jgi:hypothetical protein
LNPQLERNRTIEVHGRRAATVGVYWRGTNGLTHWRGSLVKQRQGGKPLRLGFQFASSKPRNITPCANIAQVQSLSPSVRARLRLALFWQKPILKSFEELSKFTSFRAPRARRVQLVMAARQGIPIRELRMPRDCRIVRIVPAACGLPFYGSRHSKRAGCPILPGPPVAE